MVWNTATLAFDLLFYSFLSTFTYFEITVFDDVFVKKRHFFNIINQAMYRHIGSLFIACNKSEI